ncbi:MAG: hypothetical protein ACI4J0_06705 [Huintestinicola sp.]|uniref:hypothetical protein n=1 Tax=Huintestinicola sp. TaxID=2981661 RepID=UPI003F093C99
MYKFRYLAAHSADVSKFREVNSLLNEKYPELTKIKQTEEGSTRVTFFADDREVLCLIIDKSNKCVEVMSSEKIDFLCCYNAEKIHTDVTNLSVGALFSKGDLSKGELWGFQIAFLFLNIFIGLLNSGTFSLGFMTGGFDGPFETPVRNFLMCLPFAAVYFFSYRYFRSRGISPVRARFIQLGGVAVLIACICAVIGILAHIAVSLILILLFMCAVNIAAYAMLTAMLLEFMVSMIASINGH